MDRSESQRSVGDSLLVMKHYHTASLRHLKPARLSPLDKPLNPDYAHIPISWEKGGLLFYSEVFLADLKGKKTLDVKHKKPRHGRRPLGVGFFNEMLEIPVPQVTSGLADLKLKSELGVAPGNLLSEAKLALAIGCTYENGCKTLSALKYYKKLFFAAQLSSNADYEAVSLNRMAIVHYNRGNYTKARTMLRSHLELTPEAFIPNYNLGLVHRALKDSIRSIEHFQTALQVAEGSDDQEGRCIASAQLGLSHKLANNLPYAQESFTQASDLAQTLGAEDIYQLATIALSFVLVARGQEAKAEDLLYSVMAAADGNRAQQCSCNIGILRGNKAVQQFAASLSRESD